MAFDAVSLFPIIPQTQTWVPTVHIAIRQTYANPNPNVALKCCDTFVGLAMHQRPEIRQLTMRPRNGLNPWILDKESDAVSIFIKIPSFFQNDCLCVMGIRNGLILSKISQFSKKRIPFQSATQSHLKTVQLQRTISLLHRNNA